MLIRRLLVVALAASLGAELGAQTAGLAGLNRMWLVSTTASGTQTMAPPVATPCPWSVGPFPVATDLGLQVATRAGGFAVDVFVTGGSCCPGAICLPSAIGAPLPVIGAGPCAGTNQSVDLCGLPQVLVSLVSAPAPWPLSGGLASLAVTTSAPAAGVTSSLQAVVFDPGAPAGFILTNAFDLVL